MKDFDLRAVIFDMDGVLIDSEPIHYQAFLHFFRSMGIAYTPEENALYLGQRDIEIASILIDKYKLQFTKEELVEHKEKIFSALIAKQAEPRQGVIATLEHAKQIGVKLAVASSATLPSIKLIVNSLKIEAYFHNLSSGDEVSRGKPAPDVFLLAANRMEIEPMHCLVIEDTEAGVEAARKAGMRVVAIPCEATKHQTHEFADMKVNSLDELNLQEWVRS